MIRKMQSNRSTWNQGTRNENSLTTQHKYTVYTQWTINSSAIRSFLLRCTKCTWPVTSLRCCPRCSRVTGACRPGRPGRLGARDRTLPTGSTSRCSRRRYSLVTCVTLWRWWRTPTDEKSAEDPVDPQRYLDRRPSHSEAPIGRVETTQNRSRALTVPPDEVPQDGESASSTV